MKNGARDALRRVRGASAYGLLLVALSVIGLEAYTMLFPPTRGGMVFMFAALTLSAAVTAPVRGLSRRARRAVRDA